MKEFSFSFNSAYSYHACKGFFHESIKYCQNELYRYCFLLYYAEIHCYLAMMILDIWVNRIYTIQYINIVHNIQNSKALSKTSSAITSTFLPLRNCFSLHLPSCKSQLVLTASHVTFYFFLQFRTLQASIFAKTEKFANR